MGEHNIPCYIQFRNVLGNGVALWWLAGEIAAETRLEVNHIYVLKHRGLKKLREYCADA